MGNTDAIVGLLMTLSKKERALCLFNSDVLRSKVADAQSVLEASESDEGQLASKLEGVVLQSQLPTPQSTPERRSAKGSRGPSPGVDESGILTTASLAKMPAVRIIEMVSSENPPPVAAAPSPQIQEEIDSFIDSLKAKPINEQKQKLGERLFKKIKELGFKGAPKLTIHLLDNEDLRALGKNRLWLLLLFRHHPQLTVFVVFPRSSSDGRATGNPEGEGVSYSAQVNGFPF